jgi:hypothetical protein
MPEAGRRLRIVISVHSISSPLLARCGVMRRTAPLIVRTICHRTTVRRTSGVEYALLDSVV